jgi:hypothetical protein
LQEEVHEAVDRVCAINEQYGGQGGVGLDEFINVYADSMEVLANSWVKLRDMVRSKCLQGKWMPF